MAIHSSILAWKIPWTEEPGGLQSMRMQSQTTEQLSIARGKLRTGPLVLWSTGCLDEPPCWRATGLRSGEQGGELSTNPILPLPNPEVSPLWEHQFLI